MKLKVIIHQAEEGGYWAEVPATRLCIAGRKPEGVDGQLTGSHRGLPVNRY